MELLLLNWQKNYWGNMANVEQISQVAMQVITYAGMAKSNYLEALKYYRENDQEAYEQSLSNGDESFTQAHEAHLQLLQQEMNTQEPQITMLMAHAEDQLRQILGLLRVHPGGRLIEQQQLRRGGQRAGDLHFALVAIA